MIPLLRCNSVAIVRALLSNPPPAHARNGVVMLVNESRAFDWPRVADGYNDGPTKMEAA